MSGVIERDVWSTPSSMIMYERIEIHPVSRGGSHETVILVLGTHASTLRLRGEDGVWPKRIELSDGTLSPAKLTAVILIVYVFPHSKISPFESLENI